MATLVIGNGKRAQNTILPALGIAEEKIYITGRNRIRCIELSKVFDCEYLSPKKRIPNEVNRIISAIPTDNIGLFLDSLSISEPSKITLFLETPFFGKITNIRLLKLQKKFKNVYVTEDWISKPFFKFAQTLSQKYKFGDLKKIIFRNSGYSYHSLAIARRLFARNLSQCQKKGNTFSFFFGKKMMEIIEPKDYQNCKTELIYDDGVIIDSIGNKTNINTDRKEIFFRRNINGSEVNHFYDFPSLNIFEKSIYSFSHVIFDNESFDYENKEKILSLCQKINEEEIGYKLIDGAYDSIPFAIFNKFGVFFDLKVGRSSLIYKLLNVYGKL